MPISGYGSGLTVRHHTKDKGDEGLGQVIADLMTNGVQVAVPLSEHLPFDLIAIGEQGSCVRFKCDSEPRRTRRTYVAGSVVRGRIGMAVTIVRSMHRQSMCWRSTARVQRRSSTSGKTSYHQTTSVFAWRRRRTVRSSARET